MPNFYGSSSRVAANPGGGIKRRATQTRRPEGKVQEAWMESLTQGSRHGHRQSGPAVKSEKRRKAISKDHSSAQSKTVAGGLFMCDGFPGSLCCVLCPKTASAPYVTGNSIRVQAEQSVSSNHESEDLVGDIPLLIQPHSTALFTMVKAVKGRSSWTAYCAVTNSSRHACQMRCIHQSHAGRYRQQKPK